MNILISARGQYIVMLSGFINGVYDNLRDAISSIRFQGKEPVFTWDNE